MPLTCAVRLRRRCSLGRLYAEGRLFTATARPQAPLLKLGHLSPVSHLAFTPGGGELLRAGREEPVHPSVRQVSETGELVTADR